MSIGKYLTNFGVIAALLGALSTMRQTQGMPRDWRRFVVWGVWAASLVLTIVGVAKQADDEQFEEDMKVAEQQAKQLAKAAKRAR